MEGKGWRAQQILFLGSISHARHSIEIRVLGPESGLVRAGSGQDHAVSQRKLKIETQLRRAQSERGVKLDDSPLLHLRDNAQRVTLAPLLKNSLEDFEEANGGDDKLLRVFDSRGEEIRIRAVPKILKPHR